MTFRNFLRYGRVVEKVARDRGKVTTCTYRPSQSDIGGEEVVEEYERAKVQANISGQV